MREAKTTLSGFMGLAASASAVIGLGASIMSTVDWYRPEPTFCAESGCATVKQSVFSHLLGVPTPILGVVFFAGAVLTSLALAPFSARARRARAIGAAFGAIGALGLIGVQAFVVHAWCKLCLVADAAAIAHGIAVVSGGNPMPFTWRRALAVPPATAAVVGLFAVWNRPPAEQTIPATVPDVVARAATDAGEVTVVEFVDFECPFCREMQARLSTAISKTPHRVRIVRKMTPLALHHGAMPAALAWCCADEQGRGDEMADALFSAPPEDLTADGCLRIAQCLGLDVERFQRSFEDPSTRARVDADLMDAQLASVNRLPTLFIGGERVTGASKSSGEIVAMLDSAARDSAHSLAPRASSSL